MKDFEEIKNLLGVDGKVCEGKELSTYKGGGHAFVFVPKNVDEFVKIYSALKEKRKDIYVLGGGSNTIISDGYCKSAIISTRELNGIYVLGDRLICECGASIAKAIKIGREHSLGGLEFLSGIPCTVGGAVRMNAGAFLSQTGDYVQKITILTHDNESCHKYFAKEIFKEDLRFSYRKGVEKTILSAEFSLEKKDVETSLNESRTFLRLRRQKQPVLPSCGSVFKNGSIASGKLIEECGLKGLVRGGAQISDKHANFIVNIGGGTASDYLELAEICENAVMEKFGIELQREFVVLD